MDDRETEQLDKILALADSNHEAEAVVAVRKAREMLSRDGLNFSDLARAIANHTYVRNSGMMALLSGGREHMEYQIQTLRQEIAALKATVDSQDFQLDISRRRVSDLEQSVLYAQGEAERWKKLASETADRLWEIARSMGSESFQSPDEVQAPKSSSGTEKKRKKKA